MDSFERDLTALYPALRAYARLLTAGSSFEADDLVQEGMVRACKARNSFEEGTSMRAWVMVIMRNHFLSQMRRSKYTTMRTLDDPENPVHIGGLSGNQEAHVELQEALRAMEKLPRGMSEALEFVGMEQYAYDEAAQKAGVAMGTIKSRVSRGRLLLAKLIEEGAGRPPKTPQFRPVKLPQPVVTKASPPLSVKELLGSLAFNLEAIATRTIGDGQVTTFQIQH